MQNLVTELTEERFEGWKMEGGGEDRKREGKTTRMFRTRDTAQARLIGPFQIRFGPFF